jgi:Mn2+/Fe2+ NRAMP family transporter
MLVSQTLNGVLLPVILVVMLRLVNDRRLMGRYANGRVANVVSYVIVAALIALTALLIVTSLFPGALQ